MINEPLWFPFAAPVNRYQLLTSYTPTIDFLLSILWERGTM